jgi:hypothetical protein
VTLSAQNIGVVDEVFCFHRKGRKGQTTSANNLKSNQIANLAGIVGGTTSDGVSPEAKEKDEDGDGGSSKQATLAGIFSNINYIGNFLFNVFATRDRSKPFRIADYRARQANRKFSSGEFSAFASAFFDWITKQNGLLKKTVCLFLVACCNFIL